MLLTNKGYPMQSSVGFFPEVRGGKGKANDIFGPSTTSFIPGFAETKLQG